MKSRLSVLWIAAFFVYAVPQALPQNAMLLPDRIQVIMARPEFPHSPFGIEFYSLDRGQVVYQSNPDKLMVPGSTTKLLTEGALLELLGGDYRFHTRVCRTGPIRQDG